jgi:hypothetical protein
MVATAQLPGCEAPIEKVAVWVPSSSTGDRRTQADEAPDNVLAASHELSEPAHPERADEGWSTYPWRGHITTSTGVADRPDYGRVSSGSRPVRRQLSMAIGTGPLTAQNCPAMANGTAQRRSVTRPELSGPAASPPCREWPG